MRITQELEGVLNWRAPGPTGMKTATIDNDLESAIDRMINSMHPVFGDMIQFGIDYHNFMDNNDPAALLIFIDNYKDSGYCRLAKFANGLQMDIDAVKNTLLHPDISNGPVEGINSLIKCDKRIGCGRAKIDLLTARIVIRQLHKVSVAAEKDSA